VGTLLVYLSIDSGKVTLIGMLDMSAAFDTVDRAILLDHLQKASVV